jgi:hypothetical protein
MPSSGFLRPLDLFVRWDFTADYLNVARNYTRAPKTESIQLVKRCKQKNNRISTASTGGHKHPAARNAA